MSEKKHEDVRRKEELLRLIEQLEERKKLYGIVSTQLGEHQKQVLPSIREKMDVDGSSIPRYKYILFQGGNGAGKSLVGIYITVLLALGDLTGEYNLPYIGHKRDIWIITKSGSNVTGVIQPYLLGDFSKTRIPPEVIKKVVQDNGLLKEIHLKNGTKITIKTYDQGRERVQGGNPDFMLIDEEPTSKGVWEELMNRARGSQSQLLLTMTPLSGLTPVYEFFYEARVPEGVIDKRKIFLVKSTDNKHADHSGLMFLSEQDRKMREFGMFVPPSGLVFSSFNRYDHIVPHFNPSDLGFETKYYAGLDFGVTHPTGFILVAVDTDGNHYAFDGFLESNLLIKDMALKIKNLIRIYNIEPEYIVADSAAKRERTELREYGVITVGADKWSKGEKNESNRNASIMKINQLFNEGKLYISDKLTDTLVKELEQHHYKEKGKNGEVVKEDDDIIDALRYCIWSIKKPKVITASAQRFRSKHGQTPNNKHYYKTEFNQPY